MKDTTKVWLLGYRYELFFAVVVIIFALAYFVNHQHLVDVFKNFDENDYSWSLACLPLMLIAPLFVPTLNSVLKQVIVSCLSFLFAQGVAILCIFFDSSISALSYIALTLDIAMIVYAAVLGTRIGKWTYGHIDELIPRRMRWRNSKVDIYNYSLSTSISMGVSCGFIVVNSLSLFLVYAVIR